MSVPQQRPTYRSRILRRLHKLGAALGLGHDDLRAVVGVASLADASADQLRAACDRLQRDVSTAEQSAYVAVKLTYPRGPGQISTKRATKCATLLNQVVVRCGWSLTMRAAWLAARHGLHIPDIDRWSDAAGKKLIDQLAEVIRKGPSTDTRADKIQRCARRDAESAEQEEAVSSSATSASPRAPSSPFPVPGSRFPASEGVPF